MKKLVAVFILLLVVISFSFAEKHDDFIWPDVFSGLSYINHIHFTEVPSVHDETWDFHGIGFRSIQDYGEKFSLYSRSDVALNFLLNTSNPSSSNQVNLSNYGLTVMLELMLGFGVKVVDTDAFTLQFSSGTVGVLDALIAKDPDESTNYVVSIGPGIDINSIVGINENLGFFLSASFSYQLLAFASDYSSSQQNLFDYAITWGAGLGLVFYLE